MTLFDLAIIGEKLGSLDLRCSYGKFKVENKFPG